MILHTEYKKQKYNKFIMWNFKYWGVLNRIQYLLLNYCNCIDF